MKLHDLGVVSLTRGRPDPEMTSEEWQDYFALMKCIVKQGTEKKMKSSSSTSITVNGISLDIVYCGETSYAQYCAFINSVLRVIRGNNSDAPAHDYCFFIYQIADLLRFEHDRLKVKWHKDDGYFEVWLDEL